MSETQTITASRAVAAFGYPKSGCTWLARLLADILDVPCAGFYGVQEADEVARCNLDKESDVVILKGHWPSTILDHPEYHTPEEVIPLKMSDVVYIVRDPRDVAVSMADFYGYTMEQTIVIMSQSTHCSHITGFKAWDKHVGSWMFRSATDDQMPTIVRYESLLKWPVACLRDIVERLGFTRTRERITEAVQRQSFEQRKRNPTSDVDDRLLRKGISGDYVKRLTEEEKRRIVDLFGDMMATLGYKA